MTHQIVVLAAVLASLAAAAFAATEEVAFPSDYKTAGVRYATADNANPTRGDQVRDLYANPAALAALKAGRPLPSGTVLTMEIYAKVDADKQTVRDASGRFIKDRLVSVFVMEKRAGFGAQYPDAVRNPDWEYASFNPQGERLANRDMTSCATCHKPREKDDFVFSRQQLEAEARK